MTAILRRLRGSIRSAAFERGMDAELQHHLELEAEALVARGLDPREARLIAQQRFGSVAQVKDECRDSWGVGAIDALSQDVRYGVRSLGRYPGYTAIVLLTLALGLGANTAIFSVVHAVLLRPLPYAHGDRLVELRQRAPRLDLTDTGLSVKEIADYRAHAPSLDAVVEYHQMSFTLLGRGEASRVRTGVVSTDFFDVLGVTPILGRTFRGDDIAKDAPAVLVLSHAYWQNALGGDTGIVGRLFEMNDRVHTVVGVLPPIPQFPQDNDVYMPTSACPFRSDPRTVGDRTARMLNAIGRLRPGATREGAERELNAVVDPGLEAVALSAQHELTRRARPTLLVLLATTGFVLLLVCANVANLALARVIGRERELTVRSALGAGRGRIARQLLTESAVLAIAGGMLGLVCGWLVRDLLVAFTARFTPRAPEIAIDGPVFAFTFAVSIVTGLVFGLMPALDRRPRAPRIAARQALITAQVAISFVLLVGAGLLVRSFIKLQQVDAGFLTDRVLTMRIDLDFVKYDTGVARRAFFRSLVDTVAAEPGIETAALGLTVPLDQARPMRMGFLVEGQSPGDRHVDANATFTLASPAYFHTLGIRLLGGRTFTDGDDAQAPAVAIVNRTMADRYFAGGTPVGRRVSVTNGRTWMRIVGVVNDTRDDALDAEPADKLYRPIAQFSGLAATLFVRSAADPAAVARRVTALVHALDSRQPVSRIQTLEAVKHQALAPPRLTALLVTLFAVIALLITAAGIVGVVSFWVSQRAPEIGVRMALGASRARVVGMMLRQGLLPVTTGLALGLAGALLMTRAGTRLLYAIEPTDPTTYALVIATLALVAGLSCLAPASRAAAIDPLQALRAD